MKPTTIPDGYMQDARGHLVPRDLVRPLDLQRDELVRDLVASAKEKSSDLAEFKTTTFEALETFLAASAKASKTKTTRGAKGNYTLMSYDGRYKVQVQRQGRIGFNENLQNAKNLLDQCIKARMEGGDQLINALVQDAFQVDQENQVSIGKILSLRRHQVDDARWKRAMEAISQSMQVTSSKDYLRFYERDEHGEYQPVSLDLAVL